jgi:hypothetical protein
MAASPKRATKAVTGLLLEADWKEHTAEIYPDTGPAVKVEFPEELSDAVQLAARRRVRVTGTTRRPRNGEQRLRIGELEVVDGAPWLRQVLEAAAVSAPKRDPFEGARPIEDVSALLGGLPDERSAEEIIADIESCRAVHYPPYDEHEE